MSFHVAAFTGSVAAVADTDVPALTDDVLAIQNNHFIPSRDQRLMGAMVMGPTLQRAKLSTASLRQIAPPFVRPVIQALLPTTNPNMLICDRNPLQIRGLEEIQLLATCTGAGEQVTGVAWLAWDGMPVPGGSITPLRFTSTTAAVANKWSSVTITFSDIIPAGLYSMVLSEVQSTNGQAHRWIVSNQMPRPGFPSFATLGGRLPYAIGMGQWGEMGQFRSNDLPRLQVLCNGADAAHEGYLYVVRVGGIQ